MLSVERKALLQKLHLYAVCISFIWLKILPVPPRCLAKVVWPRACAARL
jgi:hypothetical protein